jgi:hypothetical protein
MNGVYDNPNIERGAAKLLVLEKSCYLDGMYKSSNGYTLFLLTPLIDSLLSTLFRYYQHQLSCICTELSV